MKEAFIYLLFLIVGAFLGSKTVKPTSYTLEDKKSFKTPVTLFKEHKERVDAENEQKKINIMLENIDRYDGTANGQQDIPS